MVGTMCTFYYDVWVPCVKPICEDAGFCLGVSLRFDEWKRLLELVPTIHEQYPELANKQLVHEDADEAAMQLVQLHMPHFDC